ncbi:Oidioi.mRNA.OKI2018_I69.chr2.g6994.t1.cds [Oikopleura dioica]|uniref:Oidioi.mRNA.OKI2018_I69.chr2.g6994.t1.cds n=1 Tax=Oikopleura dioica TaxID=34765 RepID=A0ABN7T4R2_OIKDI|nr:Oidioi.mRNA.OKI2018_I69.chr2.g6994.t1.cds [Oikopleura dioica]
MKVFTRLVAISSLVSVFGLKISRSLASTESLYHNILSIYLQFAGLDLNLRDELLNYGCWLQIRNAGQDGMVPGVGEPVDPFDELGRKYQQCIQCIKLDGCDWDSGIAYEVGFNGIRIQCISTDECRVNPCKCDEELAFGLTELTDFASECPSMTTESPMTTTTRQPGSGNGGNGGGSVNPPEMKCCGEYPNRFPFSDKGGRFACCEGATYNTNRNCCSGGEILSLGEC